MDVCSLVPIPGLCDTGGTAGSNSSLLSVFGDLFDLLAYLFSDNAAPEALQLALSSVRDAPVADLGLEAFVAIYQATFAIVILLAIFVFLFRILRLALQSIRSDEQTANPLSSWKILLVGAYLPGAVTLAFLISDLVVKLIDAVFSALPGNNWETNITGGFHPDQFLIRAAGLFFSKVLLGQVKIYQFLLYIFIVLGLIAYALSSGRNDGGMGRVSRWIWAGLVSALIFKPVLLFILSLGGYFLSVIPDDQDFVQGAAVVLLLMFATLFWLFVFLAVNSKIASVVQNRVRIHGDVTNRQRSADRPSHVDVRTTQNNRVTNINNGGKNGTRNARAAAVDLALPALATKAATSVHPVAGSVLLVTHAFIKGRRPPNQGG